MALTLRSSRIILAKQMRGLIFLFSILFSLTGFATQELTRTALKTALNFHSTQVSKPDCHSANLASKTHSEAHSETQISKAHNSANHQGQTDHSQHDDCHCPMHSAHCCGSVALISKFHRGFAPASEIQNSFICESRTFKGAPFLDDPFQPPRA